MKDNEELFRTIRGLVDAWCDRRCLVALRLILRGYPLGSPLGDGWGQLLVALQDVRASARGELTEAECATADDCIRTNDNALHPR
ncbi:MAG: hypothetical protein ACHQJX_12585 [Candidatus Acidiferrales bacterium]